MESSVERAVIHAVHHRKPEVQRLGFPLDHPYVEQCWAPIVGPTAIMLLRRLPHLWRESHPAEVDLSELGRSMGLGRVPKGAAHKALRTMQRLASFGFAEWTAPDELAVATEVAPLTERLLDRSTRWTRQTHWRLLDDHIANAARNVPSVESPAQRITARLDLLQRPAPAAPQLGR